MLEATPVLTTYSAAPGRQCPRAWEISELLRGTWFTNKPGNKETFLRLIKQLASQLDFIGLDEEHSQALKNQLINEGDATYDCIASYGKTLLTANKTYSIGDKELSVKPYLLHLTSFSSTTEHLNKNNLTKNTERLFEALERAADQGQEEYTRLFMEALMRDQASESTTKVALHKINVLFQAYNWFTQLTENGENQHLENPLTEGLPKLHQKIFIKEEKLSPVEEEVQAAIKGPSPFAGYSRDLSQTDEKHHNIQESTPQSSLGVLMNDIVNQPVIKDPKDIIVAIIGGRRTVIETPFKDENNGLTDSPVGFFENPSNSSKKPHNDTNETAVPIITETNADTTIVAPTKKQPKDRHSLLFSLTNLEKQLESMPTYPKLI